MAQNNVLSYVSCSVGQSKNLICSCESSWNEDAKIDIEFVSSSNTVYFPRKSTKSFPQITLDSLM